MKKLILAILLTVTSTSVMAEWIYVSSNKAGDEFYLDYGTKRVNGNIVKIWGRAVYKEVSLYGDYSVKTQEEYDCGNETSRLIYSAFYIDRDSNKQSSSGNSTSLDWEPIMPDSVGKVIFQSVCKR